MIRLLPAHVFLLVGLTAACAAASRPANAEKTSTLADTLPAAPGDLPETTSRTAADGAALEQLIAFGLDVYRQQYCGVCHRLDTAETGGTFGPTHNGMGRTADRRIRDPKYTGAATTAGGYVRESIVDPVIYLVPGYEISRYQMPAYTNLSEEELHALVQMFLLE
jgi:mono/diheme cytochrome c family protein